jgi:hypothetical protein
MRKLALGLLIALAMASSAAAQCVGGISACPPVVLPIQPTDQLIVNQVNPSAPSGHTTRVGTVAEVGAVLVQGSVGLNSVQSYGALSSASAAVNTAAFTAAVVNGPVFVPSGTYQTNFVPDTFGYRTWGEGQWVDSSGDSRAPWHSDIQSGPTYTGGGFGGGILTAFNGDFSHVAFATEMLLKDAMGQPQGSTVCRGTCPTTGYIQQPPNQIQRYTAEFTSSGANYCTSSSTPAGCTVANQGRTGQYVEAVDLTHFGQGDVTDHGFNIFVNGLSNGVGPTGILANPAGAFIGGSISTFTAGNIMEMGQVSLVDNGVDAAGFGWNVTPVRTNAGGATGAWWYGVRCQSAGTAPVDACIQAIGPHRIVFDTSFAVLPLVTTFTGTCSGTNLTTSGVSSGYILNGSTLSGTGITGGTTVTSQTSGALGGAGVYVVSAGCTSSGASITATPPWLQAAVTHSANQRTYWNATATDASGYQRFPSSAGGIYTDYNSGIGVFELVGATMSVPNLQTGGYTIGTLPSCGAGQTGLRTYVTNGQTTPGFLGTVSSTGGVTAPVFCNGSAWVYG